MGNGICQSRKVNTCLRFMIKGVRVIADNCRAYYYDDKVMRYYYDNGIEEKRHESATRGKI